MNATLCNWTRITTAAVFCLMQVLMSPLFPAGPAYAEDVLHDDRMDEYGNLHSLLTPDEAAAKTTEDQAAADSYMDFMTGGLLSAADTVKDEASNEDAEEAERQAGDESDEAAPQPDTITASGEETANAETTTVQAENLLEDIRSGYKWSTNNLSFTIDGSMYSLLDSSETPEEKEALIRGDVETGLSTWAAVAPLTFLEVGLSGATAYGNILLQAVPRENAPCSSSTTLACVYYPSSSSLGGNIFFVTEYNRFADAVKKTYNFLSVLIHELGHALGLSHSTSNQSIMYPTYTGRTTLNADIEGGSLQLIYGSGEGFVCMAGSTDPRCESLPDPGSDPNPTPTNYPPLISFFGGTSYEVDSRGTLTFDVSVSDPDGDSFSLSVALKTSGGKGRSKDGAGSGLNEPILIDNGDGTYTFSWTAPEVIVSTKGKGGRVIDSQTYTFVFTATDSKGNTTTMQITVKVNAASASLSSLVDEIIGADSSRTLSEASEPGLLPAGGFGRGFQPLLPAQAMEAVGNAGSNRGK